MTKKVAILQSNYIPWKGYFDLIDQVDEFVIYDIVKYTKGDWRNRNQVKTQSGKLWLTIPVTVESKQQKIDQTHIANTFWIKKHLSTLQLNYCKSPYFAEYEDKITDLYSRAEDLTYLSDINMLFIEWVNSELGINTKIVQASDFSNLQDDKQKRLVDICTQLDAGTYLSGPAAKDYLDESEFTNAGIEVEWMDYSHYPEYQQLFGGFEHGVSILDAIFNLGSKAKYSALRKYICDN